MREYKFRGKRRDNGEWLEGDLYEFFYAGATIINPPRNWLAWNKCIVDPATVGQCTGLKDRNGKDIYEGDIVDNGKHVGVVKWMQGKCCYQISPGGVFLSKSCEVVGNIHDNPEMKKGGDQ